MFENMTKRDYLNDEGFEDTFIFPDENLEILGLSHDDRAIYDRKVVDYMDGYDFGDKKPPIIIDRCDASGVDGLLVLDPRYLDSAIIGVTDDSRVVYDYDKLVAAYMDAEGWDDEQAMDWISVNTLRSLPYYPNSPIIMYDISYII